MSRRPSDAAGSVLSFTFLDVLMCTMGSLLLLLVLFGVIMKKGTRLRRDGEVVKLSLEALSAPNAMAAPMAPPADVATAEDPAELARKLKELRRKQSEADRHAREAADVRQQEEARVTHLEDHQRRVEHELAKLHITLQALEAAESERTVDRQQAETEAKRLKEMITETEKRLDEMRKEGVADKSYAIVPYKGANGTFRRPVFIECTAQSVTIQPEGIVLTVADFDGPLRSGNPLAAAIRAAHEELNSRAVAAGQADMPDPYPLLIVRPDGAGAYAAVLDAISSWEADFGYEFVEADWKLAYAEADPRLGLVMQHAVEQARERQAMLAKAAPRRYGPRLTGARGVGGSSGDGDGGDGFGFNDLAGGGDGRIGAHAGEGSLGPNGGGRNSLRGDSRYGGGSPAGGEGNFSDEFVEDRGGSGAGPTNSNGLRTAGGANGMGGAGGVGGDGGQGAAHHQDATATQDGASGSEFSAPRTPNAAANNQYATDGDQSANVGAGGSNGAAGDPNSPSGGGVSNSTQGAAGGSATGSAAGSMAGASGGGGTGGANNGSAAAGQIGIPSVSIDKRRSAANARGSNWANSAASRRASPIARPVKIVVNRDQLAVLDSESGGAVANITFAQPVNDVLDNLAAAVQSQVQDWGLAGAGMYWRPTLVLNVALGAERHAARLAELLDDSGLDVRLPQTASAASQGAGRATR